MTSPIPPESGSSSSGTTHAENAGFFTNRFVLQMETRLKAGVVVEDAVTIPEGDSRTLTILRPSDIAVAGSVLVTTQAGTAAAGSDFTAFSQRVSVRCRADHR